MNRLKEIQELKDMTVAAISVHSPYEGYKWDIEPVVILNVLLELEVRTTAMEQALAQCNKSGPVSLILRGAIGKTETIWLE